MEDDPQELKIQHPQNGNWYTIEPVIALYLSDRFISRFIQIVNEADILRLMEDAGLTLEGRYSERDARTFLSGAIEDWEKNRSRTYVIMKDAEPVGCFGFKTWRNDSEIGYWIGGKHRGIGGLVLQTMLGLARQEGFDQLQARTREDYVASRKILARNGFLEVGRFEDRNQRFVLYRWFAERKEKTPRKLRDRLRRLQRTQS